MKGAIAIFVKTPGLSPVKTRLAVKLGRGPAEAFHLASARAVQEAVQEACRQDAIRGYYAVSEQAALNHAYWQDLPRLWQGEGGLGERMAHVYRTLLREHDFVMLVGADIPQMAASELSRAAAWLSRREQPRLIYGPSADGGFWLFGGNCQVAQALWTRVTYSAADTGSQFLDQIKNLGELKHASLLQDADEPEDLIPLRQALLEAPSPLPAQLALLRFLDAIAANYSKFQSIS